MAPNALSQCLMKRFSFLLVCFIYSFFIHLGGTQSPYQSYAVIQGDTLTEIAARYAVSTEDIMQLNRLESSLITVGQILRVPSPGAASPTSLFAVTEKISRYTVGRGETLEDLSARFGVSEETLRASNQGLEGVHKDAPLVEGLALFVPASEGQVVFLKEGENLLSLALSFGFTPSELAAINGLDRPGDVQTGEPLFIPDKDAPILAAVGGASEDVSAKQAHLLSQRAVLAKAGVLLASYKVLPKEDFLWPISGRLSSKYGYRNISVGGNTFHGGIDIAANTGTSIRASKSGRVTRAGWNNAYGYVVYLDHNDGSETRYAHMSEIAVPEGAVLNQGDVLGYVGSTGASTGPHLHFEIRFNGHAVDPLGYLDN